MHTIKSKLILLVSLFVSIFSVTAFADPVTSDTTRQLIGIVSQSYTVARIGLTALSITAMLLSLVSLFFGVVYHRDERPAEIRVIFFVIFVLLVLFAVYFGYSALVTVMKMQSESVASIVKMGL